ncbi:MAG: hypothetical protein M3680_05595 [Myxococcota bacterium]|nr:hypothetical protein [Myxococcota bacterium]
MRPRPRRHVRYTPDLTSLLDVLFIIVFVALIRSAAAQELVAQAATKVPPQPVVIPPSPEVAALRTRALANLEANLESRAPLVVRVSAAGTIEALEVGGERRALDVPLLEHSADPDAAIAYLGDRSAELRVCRIAASQLGLPDLAQHLVIIAPALPLAELRRALHRGLHEDLVRCFAEQGGVATIVDPATVMTPELPEPPVPTP